MPDRSSEYESDTERTPPPPSPGRGEHGWPIWLDELDALEVETAGPLRTYIRMYEPSQLDDWAAEEMLMSYMQGHWPKWDLVTRSHNPFTADRRQADKSAAAGFPHPPQAAAQ